MMTQRVFHLLQPLARTGRRALLKIALLGLLGAADNACAVTVFEKDDAKVEIFGLLDVGLGYLQHSYAASDVLASTINPYNLNASSHSYTGLYTGGASMSRLGVRGEAEFAPGSKAFFRFESAVNTTSGVLSNNGQAIYNNIGNLHSANSASAINGQYFARAAYGGLSDARWGSLQLGRTPNFALEQVAEYDPLQASLLYSPVGYSGGIGGGLGATENSRLDESLRYEHKIGPVGFGAQYKLAGDKSSQSAGYGWVGMLSYASGPLSLKATASEMTNTVTWPVAYSNVVAPDANVQVENTKGYLLTAMYKVGKATAKAGYENLTVWAPSNTHLDIRDYYGLLPPKPSVNAAGQQYFSLYWVGGDYRFTPEFDLAAAFYNIDTYNAPESGKAYWTSAYSLLADYTFSRWFDGYVGIMALEYSGAGLTKHAPINAFSSNGMYGIGLRFRF